MKVASIFLNGKSQAVRLPKEFRFQEKQVYLTKIGKMVVIMPKSKKWEQFSQSLDEFTPDFLADRQQPSNQKRKSI